MLGFGSKLKRRSVLLPVVGVVVLIVLAAGLTLPLWAASVQPFFATQIKTASANQITSASTSDLAQAEENAAAAIKAWLGLELVDADGGAKVVRVTSDSPAAKAGVKDGDVVTTVDGKAVANAKDLVAAVQQKQPGDKATLGITRGNDKTQIEVTTGTAPAPRATAPQTSRGALAPELKGLDGIPLQEMFGHFTSGSFNMKDKDGTKLTINITAGSVVTVAANSLTVKQNDDGANRQFDISDTTSLVGPNPLAKITDLKADAKVLVITVNNSNHASYVATVNSGYSPLDSIVPQLRAPRLWPMPGFAPFHSAPQKKSTDPTM